MPKKSKSNQNVGATDPIDPASPKAVKTAKRRSSAKKSKTARKASPSEGKKKPAKHRAPEIVPTDEEIQIRAYFISERRHRLALAGDASSDWEEARRQLLSETARG